VTLTSPPDILELWTRQGHRVATGVGLADAGGRGRGDSICITWRK